MKMRAGPTGDTAEGDYEHYGIQAAQWAYVNKESYKELLGPKHA